MTGKARWQREFPDPAGQFLQTRDSSMVGVVAGGTLYVVGASDSRRSPGCDRGG
jgi:hypothetical protein